MPYMIAFMPTIELFMPKRCTIYAFDFIHYLCYHCTIYAMLFLPLYYQRLPSHYLCISLQYLCLALDYLCFWFFIQSGNDYSIYIPLYLIYTITDEIMWSFLCLMKAVYMQVCVDFYGFIRLLALICIIFWYEVMMNDQRPWREHGVLELGDMAWCKTCYLLSLLF